MTFKMIYCLYKDSTRDIWSNIPLASRSSLGLWPWELLQAKGYICPYIPCLVLIRIQDLPPESLKGCHDKTVKDIFLRPQQNVTLVMKAGVLSQ